MSIENIQKLMQQLQQSGNNSAMPALHDALVEDGYPFFAAVHFGGPEACGCQCLLLDYWRNNLDVLLDSWNRIAIGHIQEALRTRPPRSLLRKYFLDVLETNGIPLDGPLPPQQSVARPEAS